MKPSIDGMKLSSCDVTSCNVLGSVPGQRVGQGSVLGRHCIVESLLGYGKQCPHVARFHFSFPDKGIDEWAFLGP